MAKLDVKTAVAIWGAVGVVGAALVAGLFSLADNGKAKPTPPPVVNVTQNASVASVPPKTEPAPRPGPNCRHPPLVGHVLLGVEEARSATRGATVCMNRDLAASGWRFVRSDGVEPSTTHELKENRFHGSCGGSKVSQVGANTIDVTADIKIFDEPSSLIHVGCNIKVTAYMTKDGVTQCPASEAIKPDPKGTPCP